MGKYKTLILNTALFAANSVATKLINFVLVPLYTYHMSAGEFGLTDMSLTVISLLTPLITLDIADAAVRYIVADKEHTDEYVATSLVITTASILIVAALSPILNFEVFGGLGQYSNWFILAYGASALMNVCGQVTRGMGHIRLISLAAVTSSFVTLIAAFFCISLNGMGVVGYFIAVSVGPSVAILIYLFRGNLLGFMVSGIKKLISRGPMYIKSVISPALSYSLPLVPNSVFWWIGTGINRLLITSALGISASGMYAAASKIPSLLNTTYGIFQQAWQLSAFEESSKEGIERFFSAVFAVIQAGMTVLCALLSLMSPILASILLQGETYDAWPMISTLLLSNLFSVFGAFYGTVYATSMQTSYVMKTTIFGAASCVILTPMFMPIWGTYGACVAAVFGQAGVFILRAIDSRKYLPFAVGGKVLATSILVLFVQAFVTAQQFNGWQLISCVCLVVVVSLQFGRLIKVAKEFRLAERLAQIKERRTSKAKVS